MTQTSPDPDPTPRERAEQFIADKASRLTAKPLKLRTEAAKIAAALAKKDPDAWDDFVHDVTVEVIVSRIRSYLASQRRTALHAERRSVFGRLASDTITAIKSGDPVPSPFDDMYSLPGSNDWWRLGDLTRGDLRALSHHRTTLSRSNGIEAIFFAALADRLPDDTVTVAEALTEEDVLALHDKSEAADLGDLPNPPETDTEEES